MRFAQESKDSVLGEKRQCSRDLSQNALAVLRARYLKKDEAGTVIETPDELFRRVATAVASTEKIYSRPE